MANTQTQKPVVGVAGCGTMGLPMAQALRDAGYEVWGYDVRPADDFGDFSERMVADASEFGARIEVLISVVRDIAQTHDLCFELQALFRASKHPHTLIVSSTLSPRVLPQLRAQLPHSVALVDAPMSGAPHAARDANLSFMLGGPESTVDALMPLFEAMGGHIFRLGPLGSGMTAKVLNNYVACSSALVVRRVYARALELGTDLTALREVMQASSGATWFGNQFDAIDWSRQGYELNNTIGILEKDVRASVDAVADLTRNGPDTFDDALIDAFRMLEPFDETAEAGH